MSPKQLEHIRRQEENVHAGQPRDSGPHVRLEIYTQILTAPTCHLYVHTIYIFTAWILYIYYAIYVHHALYKKHCFVYSYYIHTLYTNILIYRVHFDGYSSNWSEWYSERDLQAGKIVPIYTHTKPRLEISALRIQHRRKLEHTIPPPPPPTTTTTNTTTNDNNNNNNNNISGNTHSNSMYVQYELVGVPFIIHCESTRSCKHAYSHIVDQALRYATAG